MTLVLLPGLACNADMWREQLPALARWHPVVTDVHTRYGSIEEMAAALLARHHGHLVLCGASLGGIVAMEAVRQAPHRIRGLALLGTTARPEDAASRVAREKAIALFEHGDAAALIAPNAAAALHVADDDILQRYTDTVLHAGAQQLVRQNRAVLGRRDARLHLPSVRCPTLVVCGEKDQLTPPLLSREIAGLVPGAQLVLLPRCGHMLTMEQPAAVNAALRDWLEKI